MKLTIVRTALAIFALISCLLIHQPLYYFLAGLNAMVAVNGIIDFIFWKEKK